MLFQLGHGRILLDNVPPGLSVITGALQPQMVVR